MSNQSEMNIMNNKKDDCMSRIISESNGVLNEGSGDEKSSEEKEEEGEEKRVLCNLE